MYMYIHVHACVLTTITILLTLPNMSKATKRKHVTREVLEGDVELSDGQSIVRVSLCIAIVR